MLLYNYVDKFYVDLSISILYYLLGGIDEYLIILLFLLGINVVLTLFEKTGDLKEEIKHKFKVLLVVMISVMLEKLVSGSIKLRFYCICVYSYSELCNIILLLEDDRFKIPEKLKTIIKRGEINNESKNEQKK